LVRWPDTSAAAARSRTFLSTSLVSARSLAARAASRPHRRSRWGRLPGICVRNRRGQIGRIPWCETAHANG